MFRRKTRNSTAYTGVGLPSPSAQAPDNGALAAALTIGQNLKQTKPEVYGKPQRHIPQYQAPQHTSSLLKRNSSMNSSIHSGIGQPSTPRQTRTASIRSNNSNIPKNYAAPAQAYTVDDSFNDSELEEWGREADVHYSNEARLRDLKLHHQPQSHAPSHQGPRAPKVVKMVKKYVPTPNGITVIEVPEETMKAEIARSNSMRSGLTVGRAGSMQRNLSGNGFANGRSHSLTNAARSKKQNRSRLSSLVNEPRIDEQSELQYSPARGSPLASPRVAQNPSHTSEADDLHRQIEHEKQLARDLERQRVEYEQLKQLRLENERKLRELQSLQEEETASFKTAISAHEKAPVSNGAASSTETSEVLPTSVTENGIVDEQEEEEDSEKDVPIPNLPFAVDELDSKKRSNGRHETDISDIDALHAAVINGGTANLHDKVSSSISTSPYDAIVNSYGDTLIPLSEMETPRLQEESTDNFGIEEVPAESFDSPNLASQLRPSFTSQPDRHSEEVQHGVTNISYEFGAFPEESEKGETGPSFDPVPEVIGAYNTSSPKFGPATDLPDDTLMPPPTLGASSIRSFLSQDSKSKPIKSAMKNRRTSYNSNSGTTDSPAHQAYLSLTTAENTRLNAKLSSPDLNEPTYVPGIKSQGPKSTNGQQKRMSQSLRKQPSAPSSGGLAGRSLRPQSTMENQPPRAQNNGMSNRSFKVAPQPLPQHPVSKPNYQSPSKIKAAELYAKANKRPVSEFQSLPRKSSFTRDSEPAEGSPTQVPRRSPHRTTLRAPVQVPGLSNPATGATQNGASQPFGKQDIAARGGFRSKFVDSDDETNTPAGNSNSKGGFSSRFADSDDETSTPAIQSPKVSSPRKTLRNTEEKADKEATKEKKPKKKFLRKLFGRN